MIVEDTLREGLQTPGFAYTVDEKIIMAKELASAGIKRALVSYPPAHLSEYEVTKRIIDDHIFDEVYGLGRTVKEDVDMIAETGANISLHLPFTYHD
ncbi:MAG: hypothetical protein ACP5UV_06445, partial [Thermoplasmata archaeon]